MSVKRYSVWEDEMFDEKHALNPKNSMVHLMVMHEDYAALEARCAALAAENAGLKNIQAWAVADVFKAGAKRFESTKAAGFDTDDCLHDAVLVMLSELKTPATEAFLAEVRASGVEMFATKTAEDLRTAGGAWGVIQEPYHEVADYLEDRGESFAAHLRKGVQS